MKKLLIVVAGIFASMQAGAAHAETGNAAMPQRTITVTGESKTDVSPEQAVLSMSLVSKDKNLNVAKQHNDSLIERVITIARQYTIPKEKIGTSGIYISPEYNYNRTENKQIFAGYSVNRSLRITIDDLSVQERLLAAIVDAQIDQVNGINFQLSDPEKYTSELRVKAYASAKAKAEALAQAAGSKLGQALTIMAGDMPPPPFPRPPMPMMAETMAVRAGSSESIPALPGLITLHQSVTVTFALE